LVSIMHNNKKIKQVISFFMVLTLCFLPTLAQAQESGQVINLLKDEPAPYDGVLFNEQAAAKLLADKEYEQIECKLKIDYEMEKIKARHMLEMATLQASFDAIKKQNISILEIKDSEIKRLQELALKNPNENSHWWFTGGAAVGIVTSILIFYAAVEVRED
jgi:hypothetical protein